MKEEINAGDGGNERIIRESSASLVGCQSKQLESEEHPVIMTTVMMMTAGGQEDVILKCSR